MIVRLRVGGKRDRKKFRSIFVDSQKKLHRRYQSHTVMKRVGEGGGSSRAAIKRQRDREFPPGS